MAVHIAPAYVALGRCADLGRITTKVERAFGAEGPARELRAIVERAAALGRLPPGGTVVEYTAGTTGISLAFLCSALGFRAHS